MMKQSVACLCSLCVLSLHAARLGMFEITDRGSLSLRDFELGIMHFTDGWAGTRMDKLVLDAPPTVKDGQTELTLTGRFPVCNGVFSVKEKFTLLDANTVKFDCWVESAKPVPTNALIMTVINRRLLQYGFETDAEGRIAFPREFDESKGHRHELEAPVHLRTSLPDGWLSVESDHGGCWQDERQFNAENGTLRFYFSQARGEVSKAEIHMKLTLGGYLLRSVDLKDVANTSFRAPVHDFVNPPRGGTWQVEGMSMVLLDEAKTPGKTCIGMKSALTPEYPQQVTMPLDGRKATMLYLLHAAVGGQNGKEIGQVKVAYVDGTEDVFRVTVGHDVSEWLNPQAYGNSLPAVLTLKDRECVGLSYSRFVLQGKDARSLTFNGAGDACWLIAAASVAATAIPLPTLEGPRPYIIRPDEDWQVFKREKVVEKGSILDLSAMQDAPAGKYGFVKRVGNHMEFEKRPGVPVRFWGGNTCFTCNFLTHEEADCLADELAAMGYNIVRFHHYDRDIVRKDLPNTTTLNLEMAEKIDYLASALKRRGIYLTLDFFTTRNIKPGELDEAPEGTQGSSGEYKALTYASESAYKNWRDFATNVMNHVNPYTGLAWKDDPAFIQVCLVNEGNIHNAVGALKPKSRAFFDSLFEKMAKDNHWEITPENRALYYDLFLMKTCRAGYARMSQYLRDLGVKMLMTDQNMVSTPLLALMRQDYDVVDNHYYFIHPRFLEQSWRLPAQVLHVNVASRYNDGVSQMFPTRLVDRPFTITEWDFCLPSHFATEGGMAMGAYSALQDWDMITRFAVSHSREKTQTPETSLGYFDILNDPQRMLSERMGTLLYLRGDVKPARSSYVIQIMEDAPEKERMNKSFPAIMRQLGLMGLSGSIVGGKTPLPPGTKAVFGYAEKPGEQVGDVPYYQIKEEQDADTLLRRMLMDGTLDSRLYNPETKCFTSETGEIVCDSTDNTLRVITPRSEAFSLPEGKSAKGTFMIVDNPRTYGCFMAASYDKLPLEQSRRVMLMHLTESTNALSKFRDETMEVLEEWGGRTAMMKVATAAVRLNIGEGKQPILYACSMVGKRLFEKDFSYENGVLSFTADNYVNGQPVFVYELLK